MATWPTISVVGLECVLSTAAGGCWYSKLKIIFISQIVASNRPGGQRSGPGGWLLLSWWVWRILPSSLQVSISLSLTMGSALSTQQSYSIEGQRSRVVWSGLSWLLVQIFLRLNNSIALSDKIYGNFTLEWGSPPRPGIRIVFGRISSYLMV